MRISEFARQLGVSPDTVRRLERRGVITPARDWAGHRRFTGDDVRQVQALLLTRQEAPPQNTD
jgi:excisionase family DNA binding protein